MGSSCPMHRHQPEGQHGRRAARSAGDDGPPGGARRRPRRPGRGWDHRVHQRFSGLHHPVCVGRGLVQAWPVPRRAQHGHADRADRAAAGSGAGHAPAGRPAQRAHPGPDRRGVPACEHLRGRAGHQPHLCRRPAGAGGSRLSASRVLLTHDGIPRYSCPYLARLCRLRAKKHIIIMIIRKVGRRTGEGMAEIVSLAEAVAASIRDGDAVAMEGFTHLIPFAAGHEVIRQGRRDLTLIRMTPDVIYDQLIGAGCASQLIFSWGGNPGVGSLHRFRDAVENGWPAPLRLEEHSHAGMANRYVAGAAGVPFAVLRGYRGTGLEGLPGLDGQPSVRPITCPFTGETLTAVAALTPDVAVIHAQRADRAGNVQLWGITGVQKEAVLSARRAVVTVEEIVPELCPQPGAIVLPGWAVDYVAEAPGGAHPSYALGYSQRDNDFYVAWDAISRERESFLRWLETDVLVPTGPVRAGAARAGVSEGDSGS